MDPSNLKSITDFLGQQAQTALTPPPSNADLLGWVTTYLLAFALLGLLTLIVLAFTQLNPPPRQPHPS